MAYTKAQLEALAAQLLASQQPIAASQHRSQVQTLIDEMFSAQSRGNLLAGVQTTASTVANDTALIFRNGAAFRIPLTSLAAVNLSDLGDVFISTPQNLESLVYNGVNQRWQNLNVLNQFVPYTGALQNVLLGDFGIKTNHVIFDTTPVSIPADLGTLYWNEDDQALNVDLGAYIQKIGGDVFYPVKNQTGALIPKGTCVGFAGTVGASGRLLISKFLANGQQPSTFFMGVTAEDIANGEDGKVLHFGRLRGIDTSAFAPGPGTGVLYVSTTVAGGFQNTVPAAPNNIIQVAAVIYQDNNNGSIFIRPTLGSSLAKDEAVKLTNVALGDLLQYSANNIFENVTKAAFFGGTSSQFVKGDGSIDSTVYQSTAEKGQANGYAQLDGNAKLPIGIIPDSVIGQVEYMGTWNAATNTPTLPNTPAEKGHYYVVSTAGTFLGIEYLVGDWIISNGTAWEKVDNTDAVTMVFGRIGSITAQRSDYSAFYVDLDASQNVSGNKTFLNTIFANAGVRLDQNGTALPTFIQNISGTGLISSGSNGLGFNSANNLYFSGSGKGGSVFVVNNTAVRNYTFQDASGTVAFTSDITTALGNYVTLDTIQSITGRKDFATNTLRLAVNGTSQITALSNSPIDSGSYSLGINFFGFNASNNLYFSKGGNNNGIFAFNNAATRVYTLPDASGTLALTSDLGAYLPLTGGTLTGALNGTTGIFSGDLQSGTRVIAASGGESIILHPNSGGSINRIEGSAGAPLHIVTGGSSLAFAAGGTTPQVIIGNTGNVSLTGALNGTSASFTGGVNAGVTSGRSYYANHTSAYSFLFSQINAANTIAFDNNAGDLQIYTGNSLRLTLASTGAATFSSAFVSFGNNGYIRNDSAGWLQLQGGSNGTRIMNSSNSSAYLSIAESTGAATFSSSVAARNFESFRNDGGSGLEVNGGDLGAGTYIARFRDFLNNPQVVITGNGRLGIGTPSPIVNVEIVGSGDVTTLIRGTSSNGVPNLKTQNDLARSCEIGIWGSSRSPFGAILANDGYVYASDNLTIGTPGRIKFATGPTNIERVSVTDNGLTFNGDTAAANALDDYEEGTFTLTFAGATTPGTYTASAATGKYTKIGRVVTLQYNCTFSAGASGGSGNMVISGIPFNYSANSGGMTAVVTSFALGWSGSYLTLLPISSGSSNELIIIENNPSGGYDFVQAGDFNTSTDFRFTLTYFV